MKLTAVTANVSGHPLESSVAVGPAVVNVSKSNLKKQISTSTSQKLFSLTISPYHILIIITPEVLVPNAHLFTVHEIVLVDP